MAISYYSTAWNGEAHSGTASLSGSGTLAATGIPAVARTVSPSGANSLTGTATLTGTGQLGASGRPIFYNLSEVPSGTPTDTLVVVRPA